MRYKCHYCGNPNVLSKDGFCSICGAPQPKRSPAGGFILSLLYTLFIYGTMFAVQNGVVILYSLFVQGSLPYSVYMDESVFTHAYWSLFSKYFALISICSAFILVLLYVLLDRKSVV